MSGFSVCSHYQLYHIPHLLSTFHFFIFKMKSCRYLIFIQFVLKSAVTVNAEEIHQEQQTPSGISYCDISSELDRYIEKYEDGLASCEVAVFSKDGIITSNCYGWKDIAGNIPADENTVYE